ncbi:Wzz/FepE/Etk N-terminal domain-containing protein [Aliivibrio fischeri]|uniref:Wzz/FepE/Etk N-terminal domain-containing protein n=1 Tax=Aliivibrio fischeri TaxID=668 RepID=UPI001F1B5DFF|nr:Wzz/FepE/Etk N-terminal domain-containing protein [Aliivibrio fischeri]MCE4935532.1 Wzz/FepE/Etk N-terminal domain-containing protein [Aliivibrio fischeri]
MNQSSQQLSNGQESISLKNNDADLKDLCITLWEGKIWILGFIILFFLGTMFFALKSPNIYESNAVLLVEPDPYGIVEDSGYSSGAQSLHKANQVFPYLSGSSLKDEIALISGENVQNLKGLLISIDKPSSQIIVQQQGKDPEVIYKNVLLFSKNVNQAYKYHELNKVQETLKVIKSLLDKNQLDNVQKVLSEKYAQQLYKLALLKNPAIELIHVVSEPIKATNHIKPKRALIVILGILLGGIFGVVVVLIRFTFRKEA